MAMCVSLSQFWELSRVSWKSLQSDGSWHLGSSENYPYIPVAWVGMAVAPGDARVSPSVQPLCTTLDLFVAWRSSRCWSPSRAKVTRGRRQNRRPAEGIWLEWAQCHFCLNLAK